MIIEEIDYKVITENFEGPLDLLLHLIGRARVDIEEIFVSEVTGQYLSYIASMETLSMDSASEFIEMAATLVYIKSRMILPSEDVETEEEDPEQELISRLKTYKIYKDAAESLKPLETFAQEIFYKLPEEIGFPEEKFEIEQMTLNDLCEAYLEVLQRLPDAKYERIEEVQIRKDAYTIKERTRYILRILGQVGSATFFSLFTGIRSKMEVAVTFIAILDMLHKNIITIQQDNCFDDIYICRRDEEEAAG